MSSNALGYLLLSVTAVSGGCFVGSYMRMLYAALRTCGLTLEESEVYDEKNLKRALKTHKISKNVFLASAALLVFLGVYRNVADRKSDSKDTPKTVQVQKFRTTVNNYKTANWNNFARKVK